MTTTTTTTTTTERAEALVARPTYTVRQQSSGYTASVTYFVWRKGGGRVTVNAYTTREGAAASADGLNAADLILPFDDDPRPYPERRAEADAAWAAVAARAPYRKPRTATR